ncbi:MAG: O-antigen ligase family protein [Bacteroidota bacterium]
MRISKHAFFGYAFVITIFTKLAGVHIDHLGTFDLYAYPVLTLIVLIYPPKLKVLVIYSIIWGLFLVANIIVKLYLSLSLFPLFKQFVPIFIIYLSALSFLGRTDIKELFKYYVNVAFYLSVFGIVQFCLYFLGISISNNPRFIVSIGSLSLMRISSLLPEPSHFALVIIPAFIYLLMSHGMFKIRTIIILLTLLLTLSATSYITIVVTLFLYYFGRVRLKSVIGFSFVIVFSIISYYSIEPIRFRINETIKYFDIRDFDNNTNVSTFSLVSNLYVSLHSIRQSPLFGVGLGGHEETYYDYFRRMDLSNFQELYDRRGGINSTSGHSLLIRTISEMGVITILLVLWYLLRFRQRPMKNEYFAISLACLSYFLARCFKIGGYFDFGLYFFVIAYYCSYAQNKAEAYSHHFS